MKWNGKQIAGAIGFSAGLIFYGIQGYAVTELPKTEVAPLSMDAKESLFEENQLNTKFYSMDAYETGSLKEKILFFTKAYEVRKQEFESDRLEMITKLNGDSLKSIYTRHLSMKEDEAVMQKELDELLVLASEEGRGVEPELKALLQSIKESQKEFEKVREEMQQNAKRLVSEDRRFLDLSGSRLVDTQHQEKLIDRLSQLNQVAGGDVNIVAAILSYSPNKENFLFIDHERQPAIFKSSNKEKRILLAENGEFKGWTYSYEQKTKTHYLSNESNLVKENAKGTFFNEKFIGDLHLFNKSKESTFFKLEEGFNLFGYDVSFVGENQTPYLVKKPATRSMIDKLTVDELISTIYSNK